MSLETPAAPDQTEPPSSPPVERLRPRRGWELIDFKELYRYRELAWVLAQRDLKARYKQTVIGIGWAVIQPLAVMVIFTGLFKLMGRIPASGEVPYAVSVYCALLPWQFFATVVRQGSDSLLSNQNLVRKVYFPRMLLPAVPLVPGLVDFAVAFVILIGMMAVAGIVPSAAVLLLPVFLLLAAAAALGLALWLAGLNALYRDLGYVVPFLLQLGFFLTPVVYETAFLIPPRWQPLFALNPMAGVVEGFRWALLGTPAPSAVMLLVSAAVVMLVLISGMYFFRRLERTFVDWI